MVQQSFIGTVHRVTLQVAQLLVTNLTLPSGGETIRIGSGDPLTKKI